MKNLLQKPLPLFLSYSLSLSFYLLSPAFGSVLSPSLDQDKESIKKMAGCYEVTFQNAETFALKKDYPYHDRYQSKALEWILVDHEEERALSLQHILITPGSIIKHWRQAWTYENDELFDFSPPATWTKRTLNPGQISQSWTQRVYQVDDSPRYECSAPWIHYGNTHFWECETDAPLPRREFTKRSDYNILKRKNRHEITATGHVHDEDNTKIVQDLSGNTETPVKTSLVLEKGLNIYKKVDDQRCQSAITWWKDHHLFWQDVQEVWKEFYAREDLLNFRAKVDGKVLWERLFELDQEFTSRPGYSSQQVREESKKIIIKYLIFPQ